MDDELLQQLTTIGLVVSAVLNALATIVISRRIDTLAARLRFVQTLDRLAGDAADETPKQKPGNPDRLD